MVEVRIVFGEEQIKRYEKGDDSVTVTSYNFSTQGEADAFLKGLEIGRGGDEYMVVGE